MAHRGHVARDWVLGNLPLIGNLTLEHLAFALPPVVLGLVLAVPLGWLANRTRSAGP